MRIVIYRILGNDLPPRHSERQTESNLRFLLRHEPPLPGAERRFMLNRIVDQEVEVILRRLLDDARMPHDVIPFVRDEYASKESRLERLAYLTNLNPARNECLKQGFFIHHANFVLPLDGGCSFRTDGWSQSLSAFHNRPEAPYFSIPMWRMASCDEFVSGRENVTESYDAASGRIAGPTEPQLAFGRSADKVFNNSLVYGNADKVELLWKLGVSGPWDAWLPERRLAAIQDASAAHGRVQSAGFVCRLPSGNPSADGSVKERARTRRLALEALVGRIDTRCGILG